MQSTGERTIVRNVTALIAMALLVLNHGRSATLAGNSRVSVKDYASQARWLTTFGFAVRGGIRRAPAGSG